MIVVDASAALEALLSSGEARRRLGSDSVAVPHLVDSEICHSLRRLCRLGTISVQKAERLLGDWARLGIQRFGVVALLGRIWELRDNLTAYDATYVALAEALDCPLLTTDAHLARAPGVRCSITVLPG